MPRWKAIAKAIRSGKKTALLMGGHSLREPSMLAAAKLAAHSGVTLLAETFPTRMERGAGLPYIERIAYLAELATVQLTDIEQLILVDSKAPVSFFAYPGKKSYLVPDTCQVHTLAAPDQDILAASTNSMTPLAPARHSRSSSQRNDRAGHGAS